MLIIVCSVKKHVTLLIEHIFTIQVNKFFISLSRYIFNHQNVCRHTSDLKKTQETAV